MPARLGGGRVDPGRFGAIAFGFWEGKLGLLIRGRTVMFCALPSDGSSGRTGFCRAGAPALAGPGMGWTWLLRNMGGVDDGGAPPEPKGVP